MTLATLSPDDTRAAIDAGARLIDIRGADEHARERIDAALEPIEEHAAWGVTLRETLM